MTAADVGDTPQGYEDSLLAVPYTAEAVAQNPDLLLLPMVLSGRAAAEELAREAVDIDLDSSGVVTTIENAKQQLAAGKIEPLRYLPHVRRRSDGVGWERALAGEQHYDRSFEAIIVGLNMDSVAQVRRDTAARITMQSAVEYLGRGKLAECHSTTEAGRRG